MNRRKSREAGFLMVFEHIFTKAPIDEIKELAKECREFEFDEYSEQLAKNTIDNLEEIDALIQKYLKSWSITRISKVALAVMRCSICEFRISGLQPTEISINEAVELARKYSDPQDVSFVNGVLGSIARESEKDNE